VAVVLMSYQERTMHKDQVNGRIRELEGFVSV